MDKPWNNRAWFMVVPVLLIFAMNAVVPLMTLVNYSVQGASGSSVFSFEHMRWYHEVLFSDGFHGALLRQFAFTAIILAIEIPLGVVIALNMPRSGPWASVCLVLTALPLLVPWNVIGTMWNIYALPDLGLLGYALNALGFRYDFTSGPIAAWLTIVLMDVWHWTSLVVLLAYLRLQAIPYTTYRAAQIDGASRWVVFRHVELPKMGHVLAIAFLLRFMDSFVIYAEPFELTRGGPGNSTTLLSADLLTVATGEFDPGFAAAMSIIYFLMTLLACWFFYRFSTREEKW